MLPGCQSKPSPIHDAWLLVDTVRPSTLADEYPSSIFGAGPPSEAGTRIAYAIVKAPELPPSIHAAAGGSEVARKSPPEPEAEAASITRVPPESGATPAAAVVSAVAGAPTSTIALTVPAATSLTEARGVPR